MELPDIKVEKKTGKENFEFNRNSQGFDLTEFWSWNQSDLIENRTRGILAEFIVKKALGIKSKNRIEWDEYDLVTEKGTKIEIKSGAYIQTWEQKKYSDIKFNISKTAGSKENPKYNGKHQRWSDFYIFCLLNCKNQEEINPMKLEQWTFYVLKTEILNEKVRDQKSIGINSLLKLNPKISTYKELNKLIK